MTLEHLQILATLAVPLMAGLAARWGSNAGIKAALRGLRSDVAQVRADVIRAHERIDNLHGLRN